jgi:hypothetical protein
VTSSFLSPLKLIDILVAETKEWAITTGKLNAQELFEKLAAATREHEVDSIVNSIKGRVKWKPINDDYSNRRAISLLSKDSLSALSERNYNSQDHVGIKELLLRGIDPLDKSKSPKSINELGEICFGLKGGSLGADFETRLELSYHVLNFAEGDKDDVALSILDDGEGIEPARIEETILSIGKSAKAGLPFTHGQWGHGGSGSYVFCGDKGYTLIATRKHPDLQPGCPVGFTLVREVPANETIEGWNQAPYFEYMVDLDGKIFTVPAQEPQFPTDLKLPSTFRFGCWIKMFHYDLPSKGQINGVALKTKLDLLVMKPLLPVRIVECRSDVYKTDANTALAYGILNRYSSPRDELKKTIMINTRTGLKERFGVQSIDVYVLQHKNTLTEIMKNKKTDKDFEDYARTPVNMHYVDRANAISFTVSGQLNFGISQVRLQSSTNFRSLYEYMLVHVDLTKMPGSIRAKVIPSSRQGRFDTPAGRQLEQLIFEELKADPELGELDQEYEMLDAVGAARPEQLSKLAQKFSRIARVFKEGGLPLHRLKRRRRTNKQPFVGKDVPEILTIQGTNETIEVERGLPSDGSPSRVLLRTDAKNGYLTKGGGQLLMNNPQGLIVVQHPLHDGRLPLSIRRDPGESIPNDGVLLSIAMTRPNLSPLAVSLRFKLYDPQEGSKRLIEIQPGAAMGTAPDPFIPQEFILRVGYEVKWKNSDYDPHAFIIIDADEDKEVARFSKPIMPGEMGTWKPEREGMYQYHDTNNPDLIGMIHVLPRKEDRETSANPPSIIYVTQDGRTVDGHGTRSWTEDGDWTENKVVRLNKPGSVKSMTINLDYIGFVEYRDNMKPKEVPKLHMVIGRDFVTLVCAADQTLFNYYKDRDSMPDEYDAILDSSARGIAEVLPTLILEVRDVDIPSQEQ